MFPPSPILPNVTVLGYRELLKRLRKQPEDVSKSSTLFLQAKQMAIGSLKSRGEKGRLNPSRAFSRLRTRIVDAKKDLRQIKDDKKVELRASFEALRDQRLAKIQARAPDQDVAVLGTNGLFRTVVVGAVGLLSRGFMNTLSSTEIQGQESLDRAFARPAGQGMISVSNHSCALDDPLLLATITPPGSPPEAHRWGMCATDRCFRNGLMAAFFRAGKTLPLERGVGMDQAGMRAAQGRLAAGEWVHIFPEGTRGKDGKMGPIRRGIGHLASSCDTPPLVLPFVHSGMEGILPRGANLPQVGQKVRVLFGEPIEFQDLLTQSQEEGWERSDLSEAISQRVADSLYNLKAQLEGLPVDQILSSSSGWMEGQREEALLPLIEEQMDALRHSWRQQKLHKFGESAASFRQQLRGTSWKARQPPSLQRMLSQFSQTASPRSSLSSLQEYFSAKTLAMRSLALT